jgi:hypothetical protein
LERMGEELSVLSLRASLAVRCPPQPEEASNTWNVLI